MEFFFNYMGEERIWVIYYQPHRGSEWIFNLSKDDMEFFIWGKRIWVNLMNFFELILLIIILFSFE